MDTPPRVVPPPPSPSPTGPVTPPRRSLRQQNVDLRQRVAVLIQENHQLGASNVVRQQQTRTLLEAGRDLKRENDEMERTIEQMDKQMEMIGERMQKMELELEMVRRKAVTRKVEVVELREKVGVLEERLEKYEAKGLRGWVRRVVGGRKSHAGVGLKESGARTEGWLEG